MTSNDKVPPTATLDFKPTLVSTAEHASNFAQKCDPTHEPELASVSIPMSISVPALESFSLSKIEPLSVSALESSLVPVSVISQYNRLDEADLQEAKKLGLLLENLPVNLDATAADFGIAYEKRGGTKIAGCAIDVFKSQKLLQERCKQFAMQRGFQLFVSGSSTRPNGGGNVKYRCKKLHGQQFFDPDTPANKLQCPFYINGYGKDENWKITRACFLHNHYKFIGWRIGPPPPLYPVAIAPSTAVTGDTIPTAPSSTDLIVSQGTVIPTGSHEPCTESSLTLDHLQAAQVRVKPQRNTTMSMKTLCRIVTDEVNQYPASNVVMANLDGKAIRRILLAQGHTINHMMASRIKRQLQDSRLTQVRTSFQKLRGYLSTVAEKNPGSLFRVDTRDDGAFTRALFIPNATLNSVKSCRKILSLDHIIPRIETPSESIIGNLEDGDIDDVICGVYLKAATKDFNDDVITFALALVTEENQTNWEWFLTALQNTQVVDWNQYTIFAGRMYGLEAAIHSVWPLASHHYCMRRLIEDELETTTKLHLSIEKKQSLFDLARSDSEVEFDTLYKALVTTNEAVMAYLNNLDRANWVKYAFLENFRRPTFNELTSDLSMALGSDELLPQHASRSHIDWFGQDTISSSYPLNAFHQYFIKIAEIFHQRRQSVKTRPGHELVPKRDAQLQQILQGSQRCESIPCSNGLFMVRYLGPTRLQIPDSWRHVNLVDWECTCLDWQDQHFPCLHAIHASELEQRRINSLYDAKQNSIGKYLASYSTSFAPWPIEASPIDPSLKTPLDFYFSEDGTGRRKPGPRPKRKRLNEDLNREEKL